MLATVATTPRSSWSRFLHHRNPSLFPTATTTATATRILIATAKPALHSNFSINDSVGKNHRVVASVAAGSGGEKIASQDPLAVLLEVEGVLMDVYRWGNRKAFNLAFQKLGLDCANWTEPIYLDLVRKASGEEERMVMLFFNRIGWPTSLPTNEREPFIKSVLREKRNALDEFVMTKSVPLRPGLEEFIDDALAEDIPVVILTAYCNNGDKITSSIIEKFGQERISRITIVGKEEVEGSFYGQLVLNGGASSGLDEQLANEVRKAATAEKQKIANEVASILKVSVDIGSKTESIARIVASLRAGAEYAGVPVPNCVLIAGSQSGLLGAERIGMPCVVLRSSLTSRTEFPSANAVMDGFGGPDLTISKLRQTEWS